jgi:uncharacterized protein involved in response to NO
VITGFLLTAIPNWTGRLPLQGRPLLALVALWLAGRLAVTFSAVVGEIAAALVDAGFLFVVAGATAREIVTGHNWRNLKVLIPVAIIGTGNIAFHVEAYLQGTAELSIRVGIAAVLVLIMLIGGRVIPSFTRNWLVRENPGRLPASFGRFDAAAIAFSALSLALWAIVPSGQPTAALLLASSILQAVRLVRWAGDRTLHDRLVFVLHVAYGFVPLGFLLTGLAAAGLVLPSAGMHCWMAGAAGLMTLAIMTRASLGHTGRALHASLGTQAIYAAAFIAAGARVAAALMPEWSIPLIHVAGFTWIGAFGGFAIVYGPMLLQPRTTLKPVVP